MTGRFEWNLRKLISKLVYVISGRCSFTKIIFRHMLLDLTIDWPIFRIGNGFVPSGSKPLPESDLRLHMASRDNYDLSIPWEFWSHAPTGWIHHDAFFSAEQSFLYTYLKVCLSLCLSNIWNNACHSTTSVCKPYGIMYIIMYRAPITAMMTSSNGKIFRVTGHLCGEFTGHRTKASDAERWCFLWSTPV